MKHINKLIAVMLIVFVLTISLGSLAFADGELKINIGLVCSSNAQAYAVGDVAYVNVMLNYEDSFNEADGIVAMRYNLNFDSEYLELLDPKTLFPIEIGAEGDVTAYNEDGAAVSGKPCVFGNIGLESAFSVRVGAEEDSLVLFYGSDDPEGDIRESGALAQFAFRVRPELEVDNAIYSAFEITNPEIIVNNKAASIDISGAKLSFRITPPFALPTIGSRKQNSNLTITGRSTIDSNAGIPLVAAIIKGNDVIEEKEAELKGKSYAVEFSLDEEKYAPGTYKIRLQYDLTSATAFFQLLEKNSPIVIPDPPATEDPDDPSVSDNPNGSDNPSTPDNNPSGETGTGETGTGETGTSGSGTGGRGGSNNTGGKDDITATDDPASQTVKYPIDIDEHWAAENIKYIYNYKLMNGYEDGTFMPDSSITRAEFSAVMARFLGLEENSAAADGFTDTVGHWAIGYIGALAENKIVSGVSETEFAPDDKITREQIAVILSRAFSLAPAAESGVFADDSLISDWAYSGVYSVLAAGYMKGDELGNFAPLADASRAEVATVIYRLHSERAAQ